MGKPASASASASGMKSDTGPPHVMQDGNRHDSESRRDASGEIRRDPGEGRSPRRSRPSVAPPAPSKPRGSGYLPPASGSGDGSLSHDAAPLLSGAEIAEIAENLAHRSVTTIRPRLATSVLGILDHDRSPPRSRHGWPARRHPTRAPRRSSSTQVRASTTGALVRISALTGRRWRSRAEPTMIQNARRQATIRTADPRPGPARRVFASRDVRPFDLNTAIAVRPSHRIACSHS